MNRRKAVSKQKLTHVFHESEIRIRFNETDPLGIVWHGYYITYFEDGREAFGRAHNISYLDVKSHGYTTPIVSSSCEHKLPLGYGDIATIKTTFIDTEAAKMIFNYEILNEQKQIVATGQTTQVFLNEKRELELTLPEFFKDWKRKVGLL